MRIPIFGPAHCFVPLLVLAACDSNGTGPGGRSDGGVGPGPVEARFPPAETFSGTFRGLGAEALTDRARSVIRRHVVRALRVGLVIDEDPFLRGTMGARSFDPCPAGSCGSQADEFLAELDEAILNEGFRVGSDDTEARYVRIFDGLGLWQKRLEVVLRSRAEGEVDVEVRFGPDGALGVGARITEDAGRVRADASALMDWANSNTLLDDLGEADLIEALSGTAEVQWRWVAERVVDYDVRLGSDIAVTVGYRSGDASGRVGGVTSVEGRLDAEARTLTASGRIPGASGSMPSAVVRIAGYPDCGRPGGACAPEDGTAVEAEVRPFTFSGSLDTPSGRFEATFRPEGSGRLVEATRAGDRVFAGEVTAVEGSARVEAESVVATLMRAANASMTVDLDTLVAEDRAGVAWRSGRTFRAEADAQPVIVIPRRVVRAGEAVVAAELDARLHFEDSEGVEATVDPGRCLLYRHQAPRGLYDHPLVHLLGGPCS